MSTTVDPILAIAILVTILKPRLARVQGAAGDALVRATALGLGIGLQVGDAALTGTLTRAALPTIASAGFEGITWSPSATHTSSGQRTSPARRPGR